MENISIEEEDEGNIVVNTTKIDEETPVTSSLDENSLEKKITLEERGSTIGALGNLTNTILGYVEKQNKQIQIQNKTK